MIQDETLLRQNPTSKRKLSTVLNFGSERCIYYRILSLTSSLLNKLPLSQVLSFLKWFLWLLVVSGDNDVVVSGRWGNVLAFSEQGPGALLSLWQCLGQPLTTKTYVVSRVEVKPG